MALETTSTYTSSFKYMIFFPIIILIFLIITEDSGFVIILLPVMLLLFVLQNELQSFHKLENNITIQRSLSKRRMNETGELTVSLRIKNNSAFDSKQIELVDDLPEIFELVNSTNIFVFNIKKDEELTLQYTIKCHQIGILNFKSIYITHSDFYGLTLETFTITPQDTPFIVLPLYEKFDKLPVFSYWMKHFNGFFVSKQIGDDTDFRGIRNYQFGDKLQRINWKATARYHGFETRNLFTNMYSLDKAIDVELIYDLSYETYSVYKESIRAITSLSEFLLRNRNRMGLTVAKQLSLHFNVKMGTRGFRTLIDKLLTYEPDPKENSFIFLDRLLRIAHNFNSKSIIIVLSPLLNKFMIDFCQEIKKIGYTIVVIKVNALDRQLSKISLGTYDEYIPLKVPLFFNLISFDFLAKSSVTKTRLLHSNIPLLEWNEGDTLNNVINNYRYGLKL